VTPPGRSTGVTRFLLVVVALLVAATALAVGAVALVELQDPVSLVGDEGGPLDLTRPLLGVAVTAFASALAGLAVAGTILRAHLRS